MSVRNSLEWFKSSYSGSDGGNCLEIATQPTAVHIRDSKDPEGPRFSVAPDAWAAFLSLPRARA
ncbi:DUF397 domain-containing protein [Streptomyces sp. SYP-A7185]|uniref:DUF397 domain-containing protein n=1 Tax=Streptomyces sp. SYP-A7185 TaxID=3040076 RepID=UPI0038F7C1DF